MSDRLQRHYDTRYGVDDGYVPVLSSISDAYPRGRNEAAAAYVASHMRPGSDILELGAGTGSVAESLRVGGVPFGSYTLAELSTPSLERLKRGLHDPRYRFEYMNAENVPDTDGPQFDVVIMIALIEHLVDPMGAMERIRQIVRPGGYVFIDTPNIAKWTRRLKLASGRFPSTSGLDEGLKTYEGDDADLFNEGHLHYFTYRSLEKMLTTRCGFRETERASYYVDRWFPTLGTRAAKFRPTLFSEVALAAYV